MKTTGGRSRRALTAGVLALAVTTAGCSGLRDISLGAPPASTGQVTSSAGQPGAAAPSPDPAVARLEALRDLLDERAAAVLARDRDRFAATLDSTRSGFGLRQLELFDNLARLPLGSFSYGTPEPAPALSPDRAAQVGPGAWVARLEGRYTLKGYDRFERTFETHLTAVQRDGGWRLADDSDGGTQAQLWDLPDLRVLSSPTTLVVGSGSVRDLEAYLRLGDGAVRRVSGIWTRPWGSRVVLVVPATATEMAAQLGQDSASVEQVAAVTDGALDADGRAGADRIVVNPEAFSRLQPTGQRVVITHETTHVAVRASTTRPVPVWLSEGFADYVGYSGLDIPRTTIAAALLARVREGNGPKALPTEADFDPATATIAPSYNAAWLAACRIADRHGEADLVRLYVRAATRPSASAPPGDPDENTREAFTAVLGVSDRAFTREWLSYLQRLARA